MPAAIRTHVSAAVTEVLDAHTRRLARTVDSIPWVVRLMILLVAASALAIVGYSAAVQGRSLQWRIFIFSVTLSVLMILIFDLDRPRNGFVLLNQDAIRLTVADMEAALSAAGRR